MGYKGFKTYAELVEAGLKGGKGADAWWDYLRLVQARREAEAEIKKKNRVTWNGHGATGILERDRAWLNKHHPLPTWEDAHNQGNLGHPASP